MRLRVLIVDDELPGRLRLRHLLEAEPDVEIVGEAVTGREALDQLAVIGADVVFLDIQMPGLDGFDVAGQLGAAAPVVVFVTAYANHALRAFEVRAVDYLVKPVRPERMRDTLQHVRQAVAQRRLGELVGAMSNLASRRGGSAAPAPSDDEPTAAVAPASPPVTRLAVDVKGRTVFVRVADIDWIGAEANYVRLYVGRGSYLLRATLRALEESLDPRTFVRIHRATIVNLDRVVDREYWSSGDYTLRLRTGQRLRLSRSYREQFDAAMGRPRR